MATIIGEESPSEDRKSPSPIHRPSRSTSWKTRSSRSFASADQRNLRRYEPGRMEALIPASRDSASFTRTIRRSWSKRMCPTSTRSKYSRRASPSPDIWADGKVDNDGRMGCTKDPPGHHKAHSSPRLIVLSERDLEAYPAIR